jgi:hypothetical protein
MREDGSELKGFLPFQLIRSDDHNLLAWCKFDDMPLESPFFIRDIFRRAFLPNPQFVTTPVDALLEAEKSLHGLQPNGFIFHTSACGSTLLANMLRAVPRNISLGEPNVLYDLLALSRNQNGEDIVNLFRGGVSVLGQKRLGIEENYTIKFGSATTFFLPFINEAFPNVPRVFLYRDPVEVLASNMKTPTQEWLFETSITGLNGTVMTENNTVLENCAVALRRTIQAFLDHSNGNHMIVNYSQFSPMLLERILDFLNISASPSDVDLMLSVGKHHAHGRGGLFEPDTDKKQRFASGRLRAVADEYLGELYGKLEEMRIRL